MAWYDKFIGKKSPPLHKQRKYDAAIISRLTSSWAAGNLSANADIYRSLDTLRNRSRDLCQNNTYARKFLSMVADNIVGAGGIVLQARVYDAPGKPDTAANDAVENAWARWSARGVCDASGQYTFRDMCNMLARCAARDGEFMVRILRGRDAGNDFGFSLQILDIDRLDTSFNRVDPNQNDVRMGVEINAYGRPVAYWLKTNHPGDMWLASQNRSDRRVRVPAADILHRFMADRPEQLRGVPWMHASMTQLNNLGGYEEAAIIAARVGASKMGFFTSPDGDLSPLADGTDEEAIPYTDADPGTFGTLPAGYDFQPFNPDYPHAMFGDFVKAALRGAASGMEVAYHSLGNDLEGVNFSSIRSGTLEERSLWMAKQQWFIDAFLEPVYLEWIKSALAFGQVTLFNGSALSANKLDKFSSHAWQPRRWQWVDPLKDIEASIAAINAGLKAPQDIAAEMGLDYEDVLVKIKQAEELRDKIGVVLPADLAAQPAVPQDPNDNPAVKAARISADAQVRMAEINRDAIKSVPAPLPQPINVNIGETRIENHPPETRIENHLPETRIENHVPPSVINVAAPDVRIDAIMPEQDAPVVNVNVEAVMPDEMKMAISAMPDRETSTIVVRDQNGNITSSKQVERDGAKE